MAKRRTIAQELERQRLLVLRIARDAKELRGLHTKIEKMRAGKVRVAPPKPKVIKWEAPAFDDRVDDVHPVAPGSSGAC